MTAPRLSVVLPTRNRADLLAAALESLTRQSFAAQRFEVIVADDGSTDHTQIVAERYARRLANFKSVRVVGRGLHAARHAGLRAAEGDLLVYADDDIEALPTWLDSIARAFVDPEVALVGGNNLPAFVAPPPGWLLRLWARPASGGGRVLPILSLLELEGGERDFPATYVWGCNFSVRKDVLLEAGGFHPDGMPAEELHLRGDGESHVTQYVTEQRLRCRFHPGASVYHKVTPERMSYAYFQQRGFRQGLSQSYADLRAGRARRISAGAFPRYWWLRQRFAAVLAADPEVRRAELEFVAGLAAGYAHHQRLYRSSAELREWVHRSTYL